MNCCFRNIQIVFYLEIEKKSTPYNNRNSLHPWACAFFQNLRVLFFTMIFPNYSNMGNIKSYFYYRRSIIALMKYFDISVHQQHLFYFVKLSHNLIKLHPVARIIHRCHTNWSFTMECETEKFLVYVISDVGRINIILIIFKMIIATT